MKNILVFIVIGFVFLYADCIKDSQKEIVTCTDKVLGSLTWQDDSSAKSVQRSWSEAKKHCQNLHFAGFNDWQLPTLEELRVIIDYGKNKPAINSIFNNVVNKYYWSSTPDASDFSNAWYVDFKYGVDNRHSKSYSNFVRCVR